MSDDKKQQQREKDSRDIPVATIWIKHDIVPPLGSAMHRERVSSLSTGDQKGNLVGSVEIHLLPHLRFFRVRFFSDKEGARPTGTRMIHETNADWEPMTAKAAESAAAPAPGDGAQAPK